MRDMRRPLIAIKTAHTVIWAFFVVAIIAMPISAHVGRFDWALALAGVVLLEVLVLGFNRMRCPLTGIAGRYTGDRRPNFDIYLPQWLARYNKGIFGSLFVLGLLYTAMRWMGWGCMLAVAGCQAASLPREILYGAQQPGAPESIWALNPSTGSSRLVLRGDSISSRQEPRWAPDGRAIAFVREYESKVELYVQDSAGDTPRELVPALAPYRHFPDWSPDGQRLLFVAGASPEAMSVYSVNRDGTGLQPLLPDSAGYRCPSWAPDGKRFVVSTKMPTGRSALLLVEFSTGARSTLLESDSTLLDCPQWSPRRDEILFTVVHRCSASWSSCDLRDIDTDLAILDLSTRRVTPVTRDRNMSNYGAWSRDGQWIVFQSDRHAPPGWGQTDTLGFVHRFDSLELYIVKPDGEALRRLTTNRTFDSHPSW